MLTIRVEDFTSVFSAPDTMKLYRANDGKHKWVAEFQDGTHTKFGAVGMDDYTLTHDKAQRERYRTRHRNKENWNDPKSHRTTTAGGLWKRPCAATGTARTP